MFLARGYARVWVTWRKLVDTVINNWPARGEQVREEVDDTDMTLAEFRAAMERGREVSKVLTQNAIDAAIEKVAKEMDELDAKEARISGYLVSTRDTVPETQHWHPGADDYVVTEHGHLRIKQGHKNLAEYATWSAVKWEVREK